MPSPSLRPAAIAAHTERLDVPVSLAFKRLVRREAEARGVTLAEFVRHAVSDTILRNAVSAADAEAAHG